MVAGGAGSRCRNSVNLAAAAKNFSGPPRTHRGPGRATWPSAQQHGAYAGSVPPGGPRCRPGRGGRERRSPRRACPPPPWRPTAPASPGSAFFKMPRRASERSMLHLRYGGAVQQPAGGGFVTGRPPSLRVRGENPEEEGGSRSPAAAARDYLAEDGLVHGGYGDGRRLGSRFSPPPATPSGPTGGGRRGARLSPAPLRRLDGRMERIEAGCIFYFFSSYNST